MCFNRSSPFISLLPGKSYLEIADTMRISKSDLSAILPGIHTKENTEIPLKIQSTKRWKWYTGIATCLIVILTSAIILLVRQITSDNEEKKIYAKEIATLKKRIPPHPDTSAAISYIQSIESKLQKINSYLQKRGIKGFTVDHIGGAHTIPSDRSPTEVYKFYDKRLKDILTGVAYTPMGSPSGLFINSGFGYRADPIRPGRVEFHAGVDLRGKRGDKVKSTADGKVIFAGWFEGYGKCVRILHKNNLETLYGHLSRINVQEGQMVSTGNIIGHIGSTGYSSGDHLHYEIRKNGRPVDPFDFLRVN